jgi:hypothetical protein
MQVGLIAFTTPAGMTRDQTYELTATLDPTRGAKVISEVAKDLGTDSIRLGLAKALFNSRMTATMTGQGFEVTSANGSLHPVAVPLTTPTTWKWQVTPREAGDATLTLTLEPLFSTDVGVVSRPQTVMSQRIHVRVSFVGRIKDYLSWLVAHWVIVVALCAGLAVLARWVMQRNRRSIGFDAPIV